MWNNKILLIRTIMDLRGKFEEGNPVFKNPGIRDFRDPKVTWDATHKQWIMALAAQDRNQFYKSTNLKDWEYLSDFRKKHWCSWRCLGMS